MRWVHLFMTAFWFVVMIAILFAPKEFQESILLVLFVSFYANFAGHFSAYESSQSRQEAQGYRP